jgi:hypothetical protein
MQGLRLWVALAEGQAHPCQVIQCPVRPKSYAALVCKNYWLLPLRCCCMLADAAVRAAVAPLLIPHARNAGKNSWGYTGGVNFKGYFKIGFGEVRVRVRVWRGLAACLGCIRAAAGEIVWFPQLPDYILGRPGHTQAQRSACCIPRTCADGQIKRPVARAVSLARAISSLTIAC